MSDIDRMIKNLNKMIALDHDAIAAYESAIERLDTAKYKGRLAEFLEDHRRHVRDLSAAVRSLGGEPSDSGSFMQMLTQGKVVLAGLSGDRAILKAMKRNEDQTNQAYESAVREDWPSSIQGLLEDGLADERRHRAWLERTIDEMDDSAHPAMRRDTRSEHHRHGPER